MAICPHNNNNNNNNDKATLLLHRSKLYETLIFQEIISYFISKDSNNLYVECVKIFMHFQQIL